MSQRETGGRRQCRGLERGLGKAAVAVSAISREVYRAQRDVVGLHGDGGRGGGIVSKRHGDKCRNTLLDIGEVDVPAMRGTVGKVVAVKQLAARGVEGIGIILLHHAEGACRAAVAGDKLIRRLHREVVPGGAVSSLGQEIAACGGIVVLHVNKGTIGLLGVADGAVAPERDALLGAADSNLWQVVGQIAEVVFGQQVSAVAKHAHLVGLFEAHGSQALGRQQIDTVLCHVHLHPTAC